MRQVLSLSFFVAVISQGTFAAYGGSGYGAAGPAAPAPKPYSSAPVHHYVGNPAPTVYHKAPASSGYQKAPAGSAYP
ncbi:hypothetical protein LPJ72_006120, partial [Coemansia sp. Benny D160-2]